ncbi:MAG: NADP-dependent phosphogluconate dehydrogenase, partial [Rhodospirillaceae bacterium]|nr:NADP-dependent phosphogluconate dehydrogenase [Rhodospirillaceae bacterium]
CVAGYENNSEHLNSLPVSSKKLNIFNDLLTFVRQLKTPRVVLLMITAGPPVDEIITKLRSFLGSGDIIIDAGNSYYKDSLRRQEHLKGYNINYIGLGVSGGADGARFGPAIMAGASSASYAKVQPILNEIAARTKNNDVCAIRLGDSAAVGHFVKMMHNGIEYADMQIISETYGLLSKGLGLTAPKISDIFEGWSKTELSSFLIEITTSILRYIDDDTKVPLIDLITDNAEQKGTGKLAAIAALELGVAAPSISEAVSARILSSLKFERVNSASIFQKPKNENSIELMDIKKGLLAAKVCAYAQGFAVLTSASDHYCWNLELAQVAHNWRAGCIIRAQFLDKVAAAFIEEPKLVNLMVSSHFSALLRQMIPSLRKVVGWAVAEGISVPVMSVSLSYFDTYTSRELPTNLIQAQRDYFGSHGHERVDKPGTFRTNWKN